MSADYTYTISEKLEELCDLLRGNNNSTHFAEDRSVVDVLWKINEKLERIASVLEEKNA